MPTFSCVAQKAAFAAQNLQFKTPGFLLNLWLVDTYMSTMIARREGFLKPNTQLEGASG